MGFFRLRWSEKKVGFDVTFVLNFIHRFMTQVTDLPKRIIRIPISNSTLGLIVGFSTIFIVLIYGLLTYQIYFLSRTHLGVYIDGIAVSHLSHAELTEHVNRQVDHILQRPITLVADDRTWTMTTAELGARVDVDETVSQAFSVGRGQGFIADLREQLQVFQTPTKIQATIIFDSGPTNTRLYQIEEEVYRSAKDATIVIDDQHNVWMTEAQIGQNLDVDATREAIRQSIVSRGQATIPLHLTMQQPKIVEVADTYAKINQFLAKPLVFSFEDRNWMIEPKALADLLLIEELTPESTPGSLAVRIDPDPLFVYFQNLDAEIRQDPVNAWFDLDETTWTLRPIVSSKNELTLDVDLAVEQAIILLESPFTNRMDLPVISIPPAVPMDNPEQLGFRELLSTNTSYFQGSSRERMQNIAVSASKFHGLVIPPGGIFSFNEHLGNVTSENGFVESLIIQGDRTAVGIGGGVCQVSTTVFRTAFYGGFEIIERWAHGYRVSWYETGSAPGLDATIYSPTVDFKFRNDTDSYILIQTDTNLQAGTVTFNVYGTSQGRSVIVSQPILKNQVSHGVPVYEKDRTLKPGEIKQIDWAKDGVDVTVNRTVLEGNEVVHQDTVFSRYLPWRAVYKVGPDIENKTKPILDE
ncbi:MAG: VanW family protein [Chloroflexota bacterium]